MSKKVLLINPSLPQKTTRLNIAFSLLYLGTWLSHKGYEVNILDAYNHNGNKWFYKRVREELNGGVLAVGLSVMTAQIPSAIGISQYVREVAPSVPIIWGGVHSTLYPEQVAESGYADFVVKGEGEFVAAELLSAIKNGTSKTLNIINENREPVDINKLYCPDINLIEDIRVIGDIGKATKQVSVGMPLLTSKGCPHFCRFCINPILRVKYRFRRADLVLQDIEELLKQGATGISFIDEDFFANKKRLIEILDAIESRGLKFRWFGTARADYFREQHIDRDLLERIKRTGCQEVGVGLESGSQRVLDMIRKDITVEDSLNMTRLLNEVGIDASLSFMDGLPDESADEIKETLSLVVKISEINDTFRVRGPFIFRPYAGSELYKRCVELGMREPESLDEWAVNPYVGVDIKPSDYPLFSWVQYPMKDLVKLNFYAWLSGMRLRWLYSTKILRKIGRWRCRHYYFKFPIEMWAYNIVFNSNLARRVSKGKFG